MKKTSNNIAEEIARHRKQKLMNDALRDTMIALRDNNDWSATITVAGTDKRGRYYSSTASVPKHIVMGLCREMVSSTDNRVTLLEEQQASICQR